MGRQAYDRSIRFDDGPVSLTSCSVDLDIVVLISVPEYANHQTAVMENGADIRAPIELLLAAKWFGCNRHPFLSSKLDEHGGTSSSSPVVYNASAR
jgi:hypothetical protein